MKFSVVIPVYNRSESLRRAILSVLEQSYSNFEVLVIDDGSSVEWMSDISNIVSGFADERIELIVHPQNLNGAAARNTGILKSKGDFICFLDSDDTWLPKKLDILKETISSLSNVDQEVLIHNQYINVDNGIKSGAIPQVAKKVGESVAHYSFITNNVGGIQSSTICISSSLVKRVLFNEALKGHQDWDFTLNVGNECDHFIFIPQALTLRYRDEWNSVASSLDWNYSLNFLKQYKRHFTLNEIAYYMQRVIFPKAKRTNSLIYLLYQKFFWQSVFIKPGILIDFLLMYKSQRENQRRLKQLFSNCHEHGVKKLIIWGGNNYSEFIIRQSPCEIEIVAILDSKSPVSGGEFIGVPMWSITNINIDLLNSCDALVLATDVHQKSMQCELHKRTNHKIENIIDF